MLRDLFGSQSEFDLETEQMPAEFHAAKTHCSGSAADRAVVDDLARKLAARG